MDKIPSLCKNTKDSFVDLKNGGYSYLEKIGDRKEFTSQTECISIGLIAKRTQQLIDAINQLIEIQNGKEG